MNIKNLLLIIFATASIIFSGCKKDNNAVTPVVPPTNVIITQTVVTFRAEITLKIIR